MPITSQDWARPKTGAWNAIWFSHAGIPNHFLIHKRRIWPEGKVSLNHNLFYVSCIQNKTYQPSYKILKFMFIYLKGRQRVSSICWLTPHTLEGAGTRLGQSQKTRIQSRPPTWWKEPNFPRGPTASHDACSQRQNQEWSQDKKPDAGPHVVS